MADALTLRAAGRVLADAFHHDAMFVFIEPDDERRRRVLPWFFRAAARLGDRYGRLDVLGPDTDLHAAAIWLRPGTRLGPRALVGSGLATAPLHLGWSAFRRFVALTNAFDEVGSAVRGPTYWHLFILGVHPEHQRRGLAGQLLAPVLAEADRTGLPCYLETLEEDNLPFYARQGFVVAGHVHRPGLPEFWLMVRAPSH